MLNKIKISQMCKQIGFTLAEVLIVLGIIGIVAEMTIPTLVASYQKQVMLTQLKENYSLINQALMQIAADNDCPGSLSCTGLFTGDQPTFDALSKYIKVIKNCGYNADGCFSASVSDRYDGVGRSNFYENGHRYKFIIANGASFYMGSGVATGRANCDYTWVTSNGATHDLDTVCGTFLIDVNGPNHGPNNIGRDLFWFQMADGKGPKLYPMGGRDDAGWYNQGYCSTANPGGYTCGARIMEQDGWQMKY